MCYAVVKGPVRQLMMNKIDDGYYAGTDGPISVGFIRREMIILEAPGIGLVGHDRNNSHLENLIGAVAILETMSEMAQERNQRRQLPSKRKKARPESKSKRKVAQASRKQNR